MKYLIKTSFKKHLESEYEADSREEAITMAQINFCNTFGMFDEIGYEEVSVEVYRNM